VVVFGGGAFGWSEEAVLIGSGVKPGHTVGERVSATGGTILVGNPFLFDGDPAGEGAAYFFEQVDGVWTEVARVKPSDQPGFSGAFGAGVTIAGDIAFVADSDLNGGVYVFERIDGVWTETGKIPITASDPAALFGWTLAYVDGDVFAYERLPGDDGFLSKQGIRVFRERDGAWTLVQTLTEPVKDAKWGIFFWQAAGRLVVAASEDDTVGVNKGAFYSYERVGEQWELAQVVVNPEPQSFTNFGALGAADGNRMVTGAYVLGDEPDVVYVYELVDGMWTWTGSKAIVPRLLTLAISAKWIAVGNYHDGTKALNAGAVYTYEDTCVECPADCSNDGVVNIFDFLCFQALVSTGSNGADCNNDGVINIFDFLCFQGLVTQGCG
jgi:hypothetical protein